MDVVERLPRAHLGDVLGRVQVVGVGERHPQPLRQRGAHGRLARARDTHRDDRVVKRAHSGPVPRSDQSDSGQGVSES